eukprot:403334315
MSQAYQQKQEEQKFSQKGKEFTKEKTNEPGANTFRRVKFSEGGFKMVEDSLRIIANDECLIRVLYSSVNYYDKILMQNKQINDYALGCEGVGIIEKCGQEFGADCQGKKVAFCCDGWAEYAIKKRENLIFLDDQTNLKEAIDAFVNPLTALSLRRIILQNNHRSCIIDGASCHLGRTLIQLCRESDIDVIAVVREDNQIQEFKDKFNVKYVINQNTGQFKDQMCSFIKEVEPLIYISCVGGDLTGRIFNCMPPKSTLIMVGNLSNEDLKLPVTQLFVEGKQIKGFFLERYLREELPKATYNQFCDEIKEDFKSGGKKFGVQACKEMDLKDWDKALDQLESLHGGKILLRVGKE